MKTKYLALALAATAFGVGAANAAVDVSSTAGAPDFGLAGAQFTFDTPGSGTQAGYTGTVYEGSITNVRAQPAGSTTGYAAVGPAGAGNMEPSAILDLSSFGDISSITFLWGSVDTFNTLTVLGTGFTFNGGSEGVMPATGNTTDANSNRLVTLTFTGLDMSLVTGLQFSSTQNAFEFDNVRVVEAAVPEPASWAMMIGGFGLVGGALRRARRTVAFA